MVSTGQAHMDILLPKWPRLGWFIREQIVPLLVLSARPRKEKPSVQALPFSVSHIDPANSKNDFTAFNNVFDEHYRGLIGLASQYVPLQDAEDIVHDIFYNFWLKRNDITEVNNIRAYLFVSVRNKCMDWLRHYQVEKKSMRQLFLSHPVDANAENLGQIKEEVIAARTLALLTLAINKLPQAYKYILQLFYFEGLTNEQIALELKTSYNVVAIKKTRALRKLRTLLDKASISPL